MALGLIETQGFTAALAALDAAVKGAEVSLAGVETLDGLNGRAGITLYLEGELASVAAAIQMAGRACESCGVLASFAIIPKPGADWQNKLSCLHNPPANQQTTKTERRNKA